MKPINLQSRRGVWLNQHTNEETNRMPNDLGNWIYFASQLELRTYKALVKMFGHSRVVCQVPVIIYPSQQWFGQLKWRVDFGIKKNLSKADNTPENMEVLIECKGKWVLDSGHKGEFIRTLMMCEQNAPESFSKLLIMGDSSYRITRKLSVASFNEAINYLSSFKKSV